MTVHMLIVTKYCSSAVPRWADHDDSRLHKTGNLEYIGIL